MTSTTRTATMSDTSHTTVIEPSSTLLDTTEYLDTSTTIESTTASPTFRPTLNPSVNVNDIANYTIFFEVNCDSADSDDADSNECVTDEETINDYVLNALVAYSDVTILDTQIMDDTVTIQVSIAANAEQILEADIIENELENELNHYFDDTHVTVQATKDYHENSSMDASRNDSSDLQISDTVLWVIFSTGTVALIICVGCSIFCGLWLYKQRIIWRQNNKGNDVVSIELVQMSHVKSNSIQEITNVNPTYNDEMRPSSPISTSNMNVEESESMSASTSSDDGEDKGRMDEMVATYLETILCVNSSDDVLAKGNDDEKLKKTLNAINDLMNQNEDDSNENDSNDKMYDPALRKRTTFGGTCDVVLGELDADDDCTGHGKANSFSWNSESLYDTAVDQAMAGETTEGATQGA
eukprot:738031_1